MRAIIILGLSLVPVLAALPWDSVAQEQLSCQEYLANPDASRDRIVGSFLWLTLKQRGDGMTPNAAGTLIAIISPLRGMVDETCAGGGPVTKAAATVIFPVVEMALGDPEVR